MDAAATKAASSGVSVAGTGGSDSSGSERSAAATVGLMGSSSSLSGSTTTSSSTGSGSVSHDSEATTGLVLRHLTIAAREAVADGGGVPGEWNVS